MGEKNIKKYFEHIYIDYADMSNKKKFKKIFT